MAMHSSRKQTCMSSSKPRPCSMRLALLSATSAPSAASCSCTVPSLMFNCSSSGLALSALSSLRSSCYITNNRYDHNRSIGSSVLRTLTTGCRLISWEHTALCRLIFTANVRDLTHQHAQQLAQLVMYRYTYCPLVIS
jgi:hypothetical protein